MKLSDDERMVFYISNICTNCKNFKKRHLCKIEITESEEITTTKCQNYKSLLPKRKIKQIGFKLGNEIILPK